VKQQHEVISAGVIIGPKLPRERDTNIAKDARKVFRARRAADRPALGRPSSCKKLRPEHLETWHAALLKTGLGPRTIGHAHRLLGSVLGRAVQNGTLARNVCSLRKPPAVESDELRILTPGEITAVLEALKGHPLYPIALLALATGARRGELLALQWSDIDLDRAVLTVNRSVEETKAGLRIKPPKTRRGQRNVSLAAEAIAMLRAHRADQLRIRLAIGQGGQPELVFGTLEDKLLSPDNLSRDWRRVCRAKKLPLVSFHS